MAALSHSQVDALTQALLHLHEPVTLNSFPERTFEVARKLMSYDVAGFSSQNVETKAVDAVLSQPVQQMIVKMADHADDFYSMPGVADGAYFSTEAATSMLDFTTPDAFKGRAIYQLFYKEIDVLYDASINFHVHPNRTFCQLNLARKTRFTPEERALLGFLQPHLRQRFRQLLAVYPHRPVFAQGLSLSEQNWLLCTDSGKIRAHNPSLPALLRKIGIPFGPSLPEKWLGWFREQLRPVDIRCEAQPLIIARPAWRLCVHCLPNRTSGEHRLILELKAGAAELRELTPREKEVARWMARGKTNPEIATILAISRATVKNHVERILGKLGVENRTSAATLLAHSSETDQ